MKITRRMFPKRNRYVRKPSKTMQAVLIARDTVGLAFSIGGMIALLMTMEAIVSNLR